LETAGRRDGYGLGLRIVDAVVTEWGLDATPSRRGVVRGRPMTGNDMSALPPFDIDPDGVVYMSGELDMANADSIEQTLASNLNGQQRVLDLGQLTFLDSSGIRAILHVAQSSDEALILRNLRPNVRKILAVAGVDESLGVRIEPAAGESHAH
jgi:anti-anti-sigma factor